MNGWTTIYLLNEYIAILYEICMLYLKNIRHWEKESEREHQAVAQAHKSISNLNE